MALTSTPRRRRPMASGPVLGLILLILLVGGIVFLSRSASDVPTQTIEVDVSPDAKPATS